MPYWLSLTERSTYQRLRSGVVWGINSSERLALVDAYDAESRTERNEASEQARDLKRLYADRGVKQPATEAWRTVAHNLPNWETWRECFDRATWPPSSFSDDARIASVQVHHALAVASRRNPQLQAAAEHLHAQYQRLGITQAAQVPVYARMGDNQAQLLTDAAKTLQQARKSLKTDTEHSYLQSLRATATALADMIQTAPETWASTVHRCKHRLDYEQRRRHTDVICGELTDVDGEGGLRFAGYWLPMTSVAIQAYERSDLYRSVYGKPGR
jgi:hypothetical protein